jgi:Na+/H+ antiporter NhaD/arsenite permease-like protein
MPSHDAIAVATFTLTYVVLGVGEIPYLRIDRTGAALAGAVAMVVFGVLDERQAAQSVDYHTLALLLGMMIVVANLRLSGAFARFARAILERAQSGYGMLAMTVGVAGVLAAFFINDVVCLALTPLLIDAAEMVDADPVPLLLALATASNVGSAATITGNPQNMIVAGFAHLRYTPFAIALAPSAILGLAITFGVIAYVYRRTLARAHRRPGTGPLVLQREIRPLMIKSSIVAAGAVILFALGYPTHLVAMAAGVVLLFTRRVAPAEVYALIDWTMLAMFTGLFIVVAGFQTTGIQNDIIRAVGVTRLANPAVLTAVLAALSNIVSNVPAVLLFRPLYPLLAGVPRVALLIASASTMAGNLTVVGSIANLIVIEQARARGVKIGFLDYLRVGMPIAVATLTINCAILWAGW